MNTFWEWLKLQAAVNETYVTFDPKQYDAIFDAELEKLITKVRDPARLRSLQEMRGFKWLGYIATAVRSSGYREYRQWRETVHEVVTKLLLGKLFSGYDETRSGPFLLRFKSSVWNAIRNIVQKDQTRRRRLPSVPAEHGEDIPAPSPAQHDEQIIHDFRQVVRKRLGTLALAVLDTRLDGDATESLVGSPSLGSPSRNAIGRAVVDIKELAREFAVAVGDSELLKKIQQAMAAADASLAKRKATIAARIKAVA